MASILYVGLSQNKATIIYDTGVMDILRHDASGTVKSLYIGAVVSGISVLSVLQNRQLTINLTCYCEAVKKHVCFSKTLNCAIVTKARSVCAGAGDTYTVW